MSLDNVVNYVVEIRYVSAVTDSPELEQLLRDAPLPMIAARIKRARKTLGWSHDRLGDEMGGVVRQTLIGYEKGEHRPRLPMLERIAEATRREVRWFVDPEAEPSPFPVEQKQAA